LALTELSRLYLYQKQMLDKVSIWLTLILEHPASWHFVRKEAQALQDILIQHLPTASSSPESQVLKKPSLEAQVKALLSKR